MGGSADGQGFTLFDVVHDVVREFAPKELPLLAVARQRGGSTRLFTPRRKRDDPLGFGIDTAVTLVTPVVWVAVQQVVKRMADSATDSAYAKVRKFTRKALRRQEPTAPLPQFGRAELAEVRSNIVKQAVDAGMAAEDAERLADLVVARLALGPSGNETE